MTRSWTRKAAVLWGLPAGLALAACPALAASRAPSSNAMINLVRLLVSQGTISRDKGEILIAQAEAEAEQARATEAQTSQLAAQVNSPAAGAALAPSAPAQLAAANGAGGMLTPAPAGTIRVPYIPETVREQIREELKGDVLRQAKAEGWSSPGRAAPDWVQGFTPYGDLRIRSQTNLYSRFNSTQVPNFQGIVAGGPLDLINSAIPLLNTTQDKYNLLRFRARLGVNIAANSSVRAGIELASGNDPSPVSTNTSLGGGLFKRNIYLYKAWVEARPTDWWTLTAGRFDNPFLTTDALFDPDLKFDGIASEIQLPPRWTGFADIKLRGGAFPLDFGNQNFPDTASAKSTSPQKWLLSGQVEADVNFGAHSVLKLAGGYHQFLNIQGRPSAPCALYLGVTQCSTDGSAAFYVQKGNTLSFIRRIVLDPTLPASTVQGQPQLLGLTQPFHIVDALATLNFPLGAHQFSLVGEYLRNIAFRRSDACRFGVAGEPVNNGGPLPTDATGKVKGVGNICDLDPTLRPAYVGGNQGFQVMATYGTPLPHQRGEWKVFAGYKYLESDVVLDAFVDDDFHLGGTNAKGYIIGGAYALAKGVTVGGRWLSANQITGDPLAIDVLQIDMNVAF